MSKYFLPESAAGCLQRFVRNCFFYQQADCIEGANKNNHGLGTETNVECVYNLQIAILLLIKLHLHFLWWPCEAQKEFKLLICSLLNNNEIYISLLQLSKQHENYSLV